MDIQNTVMVRHFTSHELLLYVTYLEHSNALSFSYQGITAPET